MEENWSKDCYCVVSLAHHYSKITLHELSIKLNPIIYTDSIIYTEKDYNSRQFLLSYKLRVTQHKDEEINAIKWGHMIIAKMIITIILIIIGI